MLRVGNELRLGNRRGLAIAAAGGAFDPLSLSPAGWWKADAITGLADGVTVPSWVDSSGNSNPLVQATPANRPTYRASGINALPAVEYGLAADYLDAVGINLTQPTTTFAVVKALSTASFAEIFDGITTRQTVYLDPTGPTWHYWAGTDVSTGVIADTSTAHCLAVVFNGASSASFVDGATGTASNAGANALTGLRVGANNTGASQWQGYIGEVLIYASALSTPNRQAVEQYLKAKWGTP